MHNISCTKNHKELSRRMFEEDKKTQPTNQKTHNQTTNTRRYLHQKKQDTSEERKYHHFGREAMLQY